MHDADRYARCYIGSLPPQGRGREGSRLCRGPCVVPVSPDSEAFSSHADNRPPESNPPAPPADARVVASALARRPREHSSASRSGTRRGSRGGTTPSTNQTYNRKLAACSPANAFVHAAAFCAQIMPPRMYARRAGRAPVPATVGRRDDHRRSSSGPSSAQPGSV